MTSPFSKLIVPRSISGRVRNIISDETTPEITPKTRPVRFICTLLRAAMWPRRAAVSSSVRVILGQRRYESGDEAQFPASLHGLHAPVDLHLLEEARGVRLHRILRDEQPLADLAVTQSLRDEAEDLPFARGETDFACLCRIEDENGRCFRPAQAEVDADRAEDQRDQSAVDLGGVLVDEVLVLDELEQRDENPAGRAPDHDPSSHVCQSKRERRADRLSARRRASGASWRCCGYLIFSERLLFARRDFSFAAYSCRQLSLSTMAQPR